MRVITLDLETQNFFQDTGSNDPVSLDISVVCIHDSDLGPAEDPTAYKSFTVNDMRGLWPILEAADAIVTWNGDHFDIPLLNKYYTGDLSKIRSIDLMREVQGVIGRRLKLDSVASATLGAGKSGNGIEAVEWWRQGEIDKVIAYCTDDVRITRALYDYAMRNGCLKYKDMGVLKDVKLDTSAWMEPVGSAMTFTLPF